MVRTEAIDKPITESPELQGILQTYNIPNLVSLSAELAIAGWGKLAFTEVLGSDREKLARNYLSRPLELLAQRREEAVSEKQHGRSRKSDQKRKIRKNFNRMEQSLINNGPARLLAAIACNEGKTGEWSMHGVTGNKDWQEPAQEEIEFWGWIYEKIQKVNVGEWWQDGTGNILHASWVMRYRKAHGEVSSKDFDGFLKVIAKFIPEESEIVTYVSEISRRFAG
jgi:hypothetical protein